jgi:hypothetical protein
LYHVSNGDLPASQIANGGTSASALTINRRFISREMICILMDQRLS